MSLKELAEMVRARIAATFAIPLAGVYAFTHLDWTDGPGSEACATFEAATAVGPVFGFVHFVTITGDTVLLQERILLHEQA